VTAWKRTQLNGANTMSDPSDAIDRAELEVEAWMAKPRNNPVTGQETPMSDTELFTVIKNIRG